MKRTLIILFALACIVNTAAGKTSYAHSRVSSGVMQCRRGSIVSSRQSIDVSSRRLQLYNHVGSSGLVSSEAGHGSSSAGGFSSSIGGGGSSPVVYGRTGGSGISSSVTPAFTGFSSSPVSLATTTFGSGNDSDNGNSTEQGYAECPDADASGPVGDAVLPLLILMSVLCVYKWRWRK